MFTFTTTGVTDFPPARAGFRPSFPIIGELVTALNAQGYRRRYLYGMSMGGVILTNAVGASGNYDALVIHSSPSAGFPVWAARKNTIRYTSCLRMRRN